MSARSTRGTVVILQRPRGDLPQPKPMMDDMTDEKAAKQLVMDILMPLEGASITAADETRRPNLSLLGEPDAKVGVGRTTYRKRGGGVEATIYDTPYGGIILVRDITAISGPQCEMNPVEVYYASRQRLAEAKSQLMEKTTLVDYNNLEVRLYRREKLRIAVSSGLDEGTRPSLASIVLGTADLERTPRLMERHMLHIGFQGTELREADAKLKKIGLNIPLMSLERQTVPVKTDLKDLDNAPDKKRFQKLLNA